MTFRRFLAAALLTLGLVAAVAPLHATRVTMPLSPPCSPSALAAAFRGPFTLASLDNYGCQGPWAFAWATVGHGNQQVGVTEVLRFDPANARWRFASRAVVCANSTLPARIKRLGCYSN